MTLPPETGMRLGDFITRDMERILARWEAFAATRLPAADHMPSLELRDHAQQILQAIVADLATEQTPEEQQAKSLGLAPVLADAPETAAQTHAVLRARSGFNIEQLASEYRALRASVLSLWIDECQPDPPHLDDILRFNEAIDQALAESITFFNVHVIRSRNLLLGMLSHDLRSPLQTIQMTARYLRQIDANDEVGQAAGRLINSGARMQRLLDDLIDFNRSELGLGIRITPGRVDLGKLSAEELDLVQAAHSGHPVELEVTGDCQGTWDAGRLQQLLNNLIVNAIHYGDPGAPVQVAVQGEESDVRIVVANSGPAIDRQVMAHVFEPLQRGTHPSQAPNESGLGLGLYITSEIAKAHGGTIAVTSKSGRTYFTVSLPKARPDG